MPVSLPTLGGDNGTWGNKLNSFLRSVVISIEDKGATTTAPDNKTAIQAAIDDAAAGTSGGVVYIPQGTYNVRSEINMKSGVTLRGAGYNSVIRKGDGSGTSSIFRDAAGRVSNTTMEYFRIDGNKANNTSQQAPNNTQSGIGYWAAGNNDNLIRNVWIENCHNTAIGIYGDRNRVINCVVKGIGNSDDPYVIGKSGIVNFGGVRNIFSGNYIVDVMEHGIKMYNNSNYSIITNNRFENCRDDGIYVQWNNYIIIRGNTFRNCADVGIFAQDCTSTLIVGNTVSDTTHPEWYCTGILTTNGTQNLIVGNISNNNKNNGIYINQSSYSFAINNVITGNGSSQITMTGSQNFENNNVKA